MLIHKCQDVHDESTAASLLCLLVDLFGDALQHTTTAAKCFACSLVSSALNTILAQALPPSGSETPEACM